MCQNQSLRSDSNGTTCAVVPVICIPLHSKQLLSSENIKLYYVFDDSKITSIIFAAD